MDQTDLVVQTGRLVSGAGTEAGQVIVSFAVDARFGPTAVLGIPAVDETDARLAKQIDAPSTAAWRVKDEGPSSPNPRGATTSPMS